eukprot:6182821-Pleurochrysis_carterae.AAC.2
MSAAVKGSAGRILPSSRAISPKDVDELVESSEDIVEILALGDGVDITFSCCERLHGGSRLLARADKVGAAKLCVEQPLSERCARAVQVEHRHGWTMRREVLAQS